MAHLHLDDLLKELDDLPGSLKPRAETLHPSNSTGLRAHGAAHAGIGMSHSQSFENISQSATNRGRPSSSRGVDFKLAPHPPPASEKPAGVSGHLLQKRLSQGGGLSSPLHSQPSAQRSVSGTSLSTEAHSRTAPPTRPHARRDSLDELLQDFSGISATSKDTQPMTMPNSKQLYNANIGQSPMGSPPYKDSNRPSLKGAKCTGLFLGGTGVQRGRNGTTIGMLMCCDAIRCTKCDFKVISFDDMRWASDVDYLFFRNNYPTHSKLAPKLRPAPTACAYCCQCSWHTASGGESEVHRVDSYAGELRWVCAGHM